MTIQRTAHVQLTYASDSETAIAVEKFLTSLGQFVDTHKANFYAAVLGVDPEEGRNPELDQEVELQQAKTRIADLETQVSALQADKAGAGLAAAGASGQ